MRQATAGRRCALSCLLLASLCLAMPWPAHCWHAKQALRGNAGRDGGDATIATTSASIPASSGRHMLTGSMNGLPNPESSSHTTHAFNAVPWSALAANALTPAAITSRGIDISGSAARLPANSRATRALKLIRANGLRMNALSPNVLSLNALSPYALNLHALDLHSLIGDTPADNVLARGALAGGALTNTLAAKDSLVSAKSRSLKSTGVNGIAPNSLTSNALIGNSLTSNSLTSNALTSNALTSNGLTHNGIHPNGLTHNGIHPNGLTHNGIHANGLTHNGIHPNGLTHNGIHPNGLTHNGIRVNGLNPNGIRVNGLNPNGIHANGLNPNGIRVNGLNLNGIHANGLNPNGIHANGLNPNGIHPNGLTHNGIHANGLTHNGIHANGLNPNVPNAHTLEGPADSSAVDNSNSAQTTATVAAMASAPAEESNLSDDVAAATAALTRQLLKYLISCAFGPSQTLTLSFDGTPVQFNGSMGLAPEWRDGPLSPSGALWVSACLAARTNFYGTPVHLSLRGPHPASGLETTPEEQSLFSHLEGAFWGDFFSPGGEGGEGQPRFFACYDGDNVRNSRAHKRDCAAGHLYSDGSVMGCGPALAIVGRCQDVCRGKSPAAAGGYYTSCSAANHWSTHVITTYLPGSKVQP